MPAFAPAITISRNTTGKTPIVMSSIALRSLGSVAAATFAIAA